jgi:TatD DNase family protein
VSRDAAPPAPPPLPSPVVDDHCHLDLRRDGDAPVQDAEVDAALAAAARAGVPRLVQIGCDLPGARWTVRALDRWEALLGGVAIHPNEAPRLAAAGALDDALAEVADLARHPRVRVVGETGLDFFRTPPAGRAVQEESFRAHISLARERGLALQIHDRDAHDDVLRVLEDEGAPQTTVFHCFSGDEAMARHCAERGWYLSFAGPVTFRNAEPLRAALRATPLDRLLVETDAPYLTPHPHRGRPNASYLLPHTVRAVAEVLDRDLAEVCAAVTANAERVYGSWA